MVSINKQIEQLEQQIQLLDQKLDRVLEYLDKQDTQRKNNKIKSAMLEGGRTFKKA